MITSVNKLGIATLKRMGRQLGVKTYTINPTDINKINLNQEMNTGASDPEFIPVVYLWDWEYAITKIEKNGSTLGETATLGLTGFDTDTRKKTPRFSHIAIHLPATKTLQIHRMSEKEVLAWVR